MSIKRTAAYLLLLTSASFAGTAEKRSEVISAQGATRVDLSCEFSAGTFNITPADFTESARLDIDRDPSEVKETIEYETEGGVQSINLQSEMRRHLHLDNFRNRWNLQLSRHYPMRATLKLGACEGNIDLGGVPLTNLRVEVGAASGKINFSDENPERLKTMRIQAGASSLDLLNLGNANFDSFEFSGGAGSFDMDFRGVYRGESKAKLEIGMGSADIILPKGLPMRIETDGGHWFSSVTLHGGNLDAVEDGIYESPDFESAEDRLILDLSVGMGSIDIKWKK